MKGWQSLRQSVPVWIFMKRAPLTLDAHAQDYAFMMKVIQLFLPS